MGNVENEEQEWEMRNGEWGMGNGKGEWRIDNED